jgi:hypothetical protein
MQEHVHTGFWAFVVSGVSAVIFIKMLHIAGAYLVDKPQTEFIGKAIGALITNSTESIAE